MSLASVEFLEKMSLKIIKIAIPVVITLIIDACLVRFLEQTHGSVSLDRSLSETMSYNDSGIPTDWAIYIALIFIGAILVVTGILVGLYFCGCLKVIFVWMIVAVSAIFSYYVVLTFWEVPSILNIPLDYISLVIFLLNLVVVANMSIFWRAPQIVTQIFLVIVSVLIALVFLTLPDWTIWMLLGLLVVYDACVVLCPHGLLNILIKKSEERGDEIPALVYSAAVYFMGVSDEEDVQSLSLLEPKAEESKKEKEKEKEKKKTKRKRKGKGKENEKGKRKGKRKQNEGEGEGEEKGEEGKEEEQEGEGEEEEDEDEERGVRLGLGDFCFYGILVTRAARLGWDLVILCVFAVILGLALTLIVLALLRRPLPALPFSLILGIVFFVIGAMTFRPFGMNLRDFCLVF
jgi:presenilin 1